MLDNAPPHSTRNRCLSTRALRLAVLLLWAAALAYLSLAPDVKAPSGALGWDKLNHFAAYAVLAVLLIRALLAWRAVTIRLLAVVWASCAELQGSDTIFGHSPRGPAAGYKHLTCLSSKRDVFM